MPRPQPVLYQLIHAVMRMLFRDSTVPVKQTRCEDARKRFGFHEGERIERDRVKLIEMQNSEHNRKPVKPIGRVA